MAAIEISASDIETAISQGLKQLDLLRAETRIEVLEEGSRGVLGIGAKPARVRLTPFAEIEAEAAAKAAALAAQQAVPVVHMPTKHVPASSRATLDPTMTVAIENVGNTVAEGASEDMHLSDAPIAESDTAAKIDGEDRAFSIVRGILDRMGLSDAKVVARSVFPTDSDDEPSIWIDIGIDDEELFLGYQHEGLRALQTIVQTMWSHQVKSSLRVNLDVNGFRERREQQLMNMARRMAERVLENGKPIMLEPMPANERRIVHMALREIVGVETESSGEGPSRKVQIKPKK